MPQSRSAECHYRQGYCRDVVSRPGPYKIEMNRLGEAKRLELLGPALHVYEGKVVGNTVVGLTKDSHPSR